MPHPTCRQSSGRDPPRQAKLRIVDAPLTRAHRRRKGRSLHLSRRADDGGDARLQQLIDAGRGSSSSTVSSRVSMRRCTVAAPGVSASAATVACSRARSATSSSVSRSVIRSGRGCAGAGARPWPPPAPIARAAPRPPPAPAARERARAAGHGRAYRTEGSVLPLLRRMSVGRRSRGGAGATLRRRAKGPLLRVVAEERSLLHFRAIVRHPLHRAVEAAIAVPHTHVEEEDVPSCHRSTVGS